MIDWKDEKEFENWVLSICPEAEVSFRPICDGCAYYGDIEHIADSLSIWINDGRKIPVFEEWYRNWGNFKEHSNCDELAQAIIKWIKTQK